MKRVLQYITLHPLYIRWVYWEFWSIHLLYFPVYLQHLWLSVKARNMFFFLRTNPAISDGLLLDDSKYKTLQLVAEEYLPKTILVPVTSSIDDVLQAMKEKTIGFPIILKPNKGYRGLLVHKIEKETQLHDFIPTITVDYLLQEYIDLPLEIGLFYYRFPHAEKGQIYSVTYKEFLRITGDGKRTLKAIVSKKPRAVLQAKRLAKKFESRWNTVIPEGEEIILEAIGSHNRGTKFMNANGIIDDKLVQVFDELNNEMKGFYFGRFDIRTPSIKALKAGKEFKILDINGVGAEPTHIYDPEHTLFNAWRVLLKLWQIAYRIAIQNKNNGISFPTISEGRRRWKSFRKVSKALSVKKCADAQNY